MIKILRFTFLLSIMAFFTGCNGQTVGSNFLAGLDGIVDRPVIVLDLDQNYPRSTEFSIEDEETALVEEETPEVGLDLEALVIPKFSIVGVKSWVRADNQDAVYDEFLGNHSYANSRKFIVGFLFDNVEEYHPYNYNDLDGLLRFNVHVYTKDSLEFVCGKENVEPDRHYFDDGVNFYYYGFTFVHGKYDNFGCDLKTDAQYSVEIVSYLNDSNFVSSGFAFTVQ